MAKASINPELAGINLIGEGSELEGTMRSSTDVRVNGTIVGTLEVEGKVIIADKGFVDGALRSGNADIAGRVEGDIIVENRLLLKSTARVTGTIKTGRLVMEEGAVFDGSCDMGRLEAHRKSQQANGSREQAVEFVFETANRAQG